MNYWSEQTKNHVAKVSKMIGGFLNGMKKHFEGALGSDGLHQPIRQPFYEFTAAIRVSVPDFRPYFSSSKGSFNSALILPYPNVAVNSDRVIYLDEVKELAEM